MYRQEKVVYLVPSDFLYSPLNPTYILIFFFATVMSEPALYRLLLFHVSKSHAHFS
jgi:hypothetical protein